MFRGMHQILEMSIESGCNEAIASMSSIELRKKPKSGGGCPA
jgi:hypothetical protein